MEMLPPKIVDRDTYRGYDDFECIDTFEKDGFLVSRIQCTNSEGVEENYEQGEKEGWDEDEINQACWDDESIIITYEWEKEIPEHILEDAEKYFTKNK